jgi:hypothetical protein
MQFSLAALTPTRGRPAYVYEIEINEVAPGFHILDPLKEITSGLNGPLNTPTYQHDGHPDFILGVVDPENQAACLNKVCTQPPGSGGTPRPANLSIELETIVRAIRDSEILSLGTIPAALVRNRFNVWGIEDNEN